jgi:hypothetical protein
MEDVGSAESSTARGRGQEFSTSICFQIEWF